MTTLPTTKLEPYRSIRQAAHLLGIKPWALRKAVKDGLVPGYKFIGNKWMVKLSEVEAAIHTFNQGGVA